MQHSEITQSGWRPWLIWAIAAAFVILVLGFQACYAIINREIARDLSLTPDEIGLIGTTYTWCFAVAQMVSGALLDRLGARRVLPVACATISTGIFCFALAGGLPGLLMAQVLVGLGAAFGFAGAGFVSRMWFSFERYSFLLGLVQFVASFSACICQLTLSHALAGVPYSQTICGLGGFGIFLVIVMLFWLREPAGHHMDPLGRPAVFVRNILLDVLKVIRPPQMWLIMLLGAASFGTMICVGAVWGPRLLAAQGLPETASNAAVALSWLGLAIGAPIFAWWAQKYDREVLAVAIGLLGQGFCLALMLLANFTSALAFNLSMAAWGWFAGGSILSFSLAGQLAGKLYVGTSVSLTNGAQFVAAGLFIYIGGVLQGPLFNLATHRAMSYLPLILFLAAGLCFFLKKPQVNDE